MKPGTMTDAGLRLQSLLEKSARSSTYLALAPGALRRTKLVVKIFEVNGERSLGDILRADAVELACLRHPWLVPVHSFGRVSEDERLLVARSHVPGNDLLHATRGLRPRQLVPWFLAAAEILAVLHRCRILHRNLKATDYIVPKASHSWRRRRAQLVLFDPACRLPQRQKQAA